MKVRVTAELRFICFSMNDIHFMNAIKAVTTDRWCLASGSQLTSDRFSEPDIQRAATQNVLKNETEA